MNKNKSSNQPRFEKFGGSLGANRNQSSLEGVISTGSSVFFGTPGIHGHFDRFLYFRSGRVILVVRMIPIEGIMTIGH